MQKIALVTSFVLPILGAVPIYFIGQKTERLRDLLAGIISGLTFVCVLSLYPWAVNKGFEIKVPYLLGTGIWFKVEPIGYIFAFITSFVWFLVTLYSIEYITTKSHERNRFFGFLILTLGATVGIFFTGDLLSLFLFFEMMTFTSYVLVIHDEGKHVLEAGRLYLYMAIGGGLILLMGLLILYHELGSLEFGFLSNNIWQLGRKKYLVGLLLLLGFGVKAGMVPVHIWLPKAHPVAPTPASALLSGILIKTGAYGILKTANTLFGWDITLGYIIIFIALITMFLGAFLALFQDNAKRILACSSMSQMGYILLGLGVAVFLGKDGGIAFAGSLYHVFNHALFKSTLFLSIGVIYIRTHELSIKKLGGFLYKMPFVSAVYLIAMFGIGGIPGFNGFASKTLLHESLLETYYLTGLRFFNIAEKIFTITNGLTLCYLIKLFVEVFLGKPSPSVHIEKNTKDFPIMKSVFIIFSAVVLFVGLNPNFLLNKIFLHAVGSNSFYAGHEVLMHLKEFSFFNFHNIKGSLVSALIALTLLVVFYRYKVFDFNLPQWLSLEYLVYKPVGNVIITVIYSGFHFLDKGVDGIYKHTSDFLGGVCQKAGIIDSTVDSLYKHSSDFFSGACQKVEKFDASVGNIYKHSSTINNTSTKFVNVFENRYKKAGVFFRKFLSVNSLKVFNLNMAVLLFASFIVAVLLVFIYYVTNRGIHLII